MAEEHKMSGNKDSFSMQRSAVLQREASPRPSSVGSAHSSSSNMSTRIASQGRHDICVGEELKIAVDIALERFRLNEEQKMMEFPSSLTATERAYIHRLAQNLGFKTKSKGKGPNRYLTVTKKEGNQTVQGTAVFYLVRNSRHQIHNLIQRFPLTNKERQDLQPKAEKTQLTEAMSREFTKATTGKLNNGVPQVPPARGPSDLAAFRESLPVSAMREEITKAITNNRVVLICGETGSGKTTQVPQMILDEGQKHNTPCRIICTQPRRISAITVAERVAAERGEKIGQTVGYQIRLESRVSPKTLLTFCTNGVLLRTLMGGDGSPSTVTHVLIDEIHERDRFSDFLLIVLREVLPRFKHLKLVLMSAALNTQLFSSYFGHCPIISVPGKLFEVKEYFLEDVLKWTGYMNKDMVKYKSDLSKVSSQVKQLNDWCSQQVAAPAQESLTDDTEFSDLGDSIDEEEKDVEIKAEKEELETWVIKEMDQHLSELWLTGNEDLFHQILHLILHENVSVDYMHSQTSATALMITAGRGFFTMVEQLLSLGANPNLKASNDWTALDWAKKFNHIDIAELLEANMGCTIEDKHDEEELVSQSKSISQEDRDLLNLYHHCWDDEKVDTELIFCLLQKIISSKQEGAILVFLPGYDNIVALRDRITDDKKFADNGKYVLYCLHSSMQSTDQKKIFKAPPPGYRKIILSTNIAETSVTINDVVFVVDSGKVKEKSFDALTSVSMLKSNWVSQASAMQRKGRAGRCKPGVCYHLFSSVRYTEAMQEYQDPEILRYPLQELCLHTKLLAPTNYPIADFLSKAPEPPPFLVVRNAVHLLKQMDALDQFEDLTELGHHLADLPIEPKYAKMILYSIVLKCLDPVLTIACALAYRDPFQLPAVPSRKRAANIARKKFAAESYSDHMALLRAFQGWQRARAEGWERSFCEKNFLSAATMEMIVNMRTQLLGQLRASGFVRSRGNGDIRDLNTNSENWAVVKAALVAGIYPCVLRVDRAARKMITQKEAKVRFHTSSTLGMTNKHSVMSHAAAIKKLPSDWLIFEEMTRAHWLAQVKTCTVVSPITVAVFAGPARLAQEAIRDVENGGGGDGYVESSDSEAEDGEKGKKLTLAVDEWINFRVDSEAALLALQLRQKWHSLFLRRMRAPNKPWSQVDEGVIRAVVSVLTNEEHALGLQQPAGIGQRPRPMATDVGNMMSGGSNPGSFDTDHFDDSASGWGDRQNTPQKGRPFRVFTNSPRKKDQPKHRQDEVDSSLRSEASAPSSTTNSGNNSSHGSNGSSPCSSPKFGSPSQPDKENAGIQVCRYFVMKCNNYRQIDISLQKGIWITTMANEKKINKALQDGKEVVLIFSVQGSGHFQGFAKIMGESSIAAEKPKEFVAPGMGAPFPVEWGKRANLQFQQAHHLLNPWNENRKVQVSRDGQEIEPNVGEQLVKLWDKLPHYQPRSPQSGHYDGRGDLDHHDHGSRDAQQWGNQGRQFNRGYRTPRRQYGPNQGNWGWQGHGFSTPRHPNKGPRFPGTPISTMNPHLAAAFSPLYVAPMMHGHMVSQASPGNLMFPHHAHGQSQGQSVSPVMILQRGGSSDGQPRSSPQPSSPSQASQNRG